MVYAMLSIRVWAAAKKIDGAQAELSRRNFGRGDATRSTTDHKKVIYCTMYVILSRFDGLLFANRIKY